MTDQEYKDWEKQVKKTEKHNNKVLTDFEQWLSAKSLKPKTISTHVENMRFFANEFLLRDEITRIEVGHDRIYGYLGDFFIRKTTWASKITINENIAGFKKLYTFLHENKKISKRDLDSMKLTIKECKEEWIEELPSYDESPFGF